MVKRLKNKLFLLAVAGLVYQLLEYTGIKLPNETFRVLVDSISYILIGTGVYSSFEDKKEE